MAYIRAFGSYLPARVVTNAELAPLVCGEEAWMLRNTGISERRFAAPQQTVAELGVLAAKDCLSNAGMLASEIGFVITASSSAERRFPGPSSSIAAALAINGVPAVDLPIASAGSLFGIGMASQLAAAYGNVLVIGAEIMSRVIQVSPLGKDTAVLFGDGAGACIVTRDPGFAEIADSNLHSDGEFAEALQLSLDSPLYMDGRTVILHASRKMPRVIQETLERNHLAAAEIGVFLLHQANWNLITRVASALEAPKSKFFSNLHKYGNTSSASLLIAGAEWRSQNLNPLESPAILCAFGAGLNWGAILLRPA
jgi:3-oxoacyl-[acyl-carrier-protein] synthase-3